MKFPKAKSPQVYKTLSTKLKSSEKAKFSTSDDEKWKWGDLYLYEVYLNEF